MVLEHNWSNTQWDWEIAGLVHNGPGTHKDWDMKVRPNGNDMTPPIASVEI